MKRSTLVFVHGFHSSPVVWEQFLRLLRADKDLNDAGFSFDAGFSYPTYLTEWNPTKRLPSILECGKYLSDYVARIDSDQIFLVGHSMGGLVIQSALAEFLNEKRGKELKKIRSVILFATPNRGSTLFQTVRGIVRTFLNNKQEEDLQVLNEAMASVSDTIVESVLRAEAVDACACPIPFRVFWGLQDNVVTESSARGPFAEASALPGGHNEIVQPVDAQDERFKALKEALLRPVGHPCIYEIELFSVTLKLTPIPGSPKITLDEDVKPQTFVGFDKAIRDLSIRFSKQNRCSRPYEQMYRSDDGYVEVLRFTEPNLASRAEMSEYYDTAKKFTYVFSPERDVSFDFSVAVYNGFGAGQRTWHNHMNAKANYQEIRFTLDLLGYREAGYALTSEPAFYYYDQDTMDHKLCKYRSLGQPLTPASDSSDGWVRTWKIFDTRGGVIDVVWDYKKDQ